LDDRSPDCALPLLGLDVDSVKTETVVLEDPVDSAVVSDLAQSMDYYRRVLGMHAETTGRGGAALMATM
jgi:hypothetical protein